MATLRASVPAATSVRASRISAARPVLPVRRVVAARAQQTSDVKANVAPEVSKVVALSAAASTLMYSGNALAAQELINVAASDNRLGLLATLFVPALGWVAFNILSPALNQLDKMNDFKDSADPSASRRRGVAGAIGLGAASLLMAENAEAATELAQMAASDNRLGLLATLFVPALGWVGFNILSPALNQLDKMTDFKDSANPSVSKRR